MEALEPTLVSILARIADGSLGAAGAQLWESLAGLFKDGKGELPRPGDTPTPTEVGEIAKTLARHARDDEALAEQLRDWVAKAKSISADGSVFNTVSGPVSGSVVQIGNIGIERNE